MGGSVAMLEWLQTATTPWYVNTKMRLLSSSGLCGNLPAAKWLRAQGADWPPAFVSGVQDEAGATLGCWRVSVVQWALASGSGWLDWKCEDYAADKYRHIKLKLQAEDVLVWGHANGCPCTCGYVQQQQQQQQQQD
eukprot:15434-Heterococcus_DN1.PRE.1